MQDDFADLQRLMDRQDFLRRNPPRCPNCDTDQVQLVTNFTTPAWWRCRRCKFKFDHEPKAMLKPPPGELVVECPKCGAKVSETCCAFQDYDYYKDCYHWVTKPKGAS